MIQALQHLWRQNERINQHLLSQIKEDWLDYRYGPRVRNVQRVWGHIHQVRLMWLGAVGLDQGPGLEKVRSSDGGGVERLQGSLGASATAIENMLALLLEKDAKVPGFPGSPLDFLGYLMAHEAHHRGQIIVALRLNGNPLSSDAIHSLWDWK